jgi:large subunit ribosomal protein L15
MQQHELRPPTGATRKRKRVGRGNASGHGTYSTRGMKGQKARSGGGVRPHFEGGQLPFVRRMAYKRGFRNPFRIEYDEVNVGDLARFEANTTVNEAALRGARLVRGGHPLKVLGDGDLTIALTVEAHRFTKQARAKIEAAGGRVHWIDGEPESKQDAAPAAEAAPEAEVKAPKARAKKTAEEQAPTDSGEPEREEASDGTSS